MFYTNAYQFVNKRDLLLVQIADKNPNLILISELLPKFSSFTVHPALFVLPGYSSYLNFDADCVSSNLNIRARRSRHHKFSLMTLLIVTIMYGSKLRCKAQIHY